MFGRSSRWRVAWGILDRSDGGGRFGGFGRCIASECGFVHYWVMFGDDGGVIGWFRLVVDRSKCRCSSLRAFSIVSHGVMVAMLIFGCVML